ncbi:hypothetical protein DXT99_14085 [Pontibacter diazotrophicus]|uniref:Uncharacterized protein n=1 Tax=Pontibacter diazotrophicus TaxID=1400979 RepID=A0A3D8LB51_9BACT|nr:hypothetical protein DXT99_14085 [Pontibacter diazotrophicus]
MIAPPAGEYIQLHSFLSGQGSPSQNLIRIVTGTYSGSAASVNSSYTYEFDEKGYPTLITFYSKASEGFSPRESASETKHTYSCD